MAQAGSIPLLGAARGRAGGGLFFQASFDDEAQSSGRELTPQGSVSRGWVYTRYLKCRSITLQLE